MRIESMRRRVLRGCSWVLAAALFLVGCSSPLNGEETLSLSPVATAQPTGAARPAKPTLEPSPVAEPVSLVVLHTNDTWGATDPCG